MYRYEKCFMMNQPKAVCSSVAVCMTSVLQNLELITENLTQLDSNIGS
jgi:hypothetical protein